MVLVLVLLVLVWVPSAALSATYYMSPSGTGTACSEAVPCSNYATAWGKLTPGDTLYFKGGSYGNLSITNQRGPVGTAANPIIMTSAPGEMATIAGMAFSIYADASGCGGGTCEIAYIIIDRVTIAGSGDGFGINSYHPFDVPNPGVHHMTLQNSEVRNNAGQGVSFFGHTGHHNVLRNNLIHDNGTDSFLEHGFYGNDHQDILIEHNVFYNNAAYGLQVWVASGAGPVAKRYTIRNNILRDNGYGGMTLSHIDDTKVYNNIIYNNGFGPTPEGGGLSISYGSPPNMRVWNNTITGNNGDCIALGSVASGSTVVAPHVINNICANNSRGIAAGSDTSVSSPTYTTNLCGSAGTGCHVIGTPGFADSPGHDYHLTALSPARNAGTTLTAFTTDYDGAARGQGPGNVWDIGAYEYTEGGGVPPNGNPIYIAQTGGNDSNDCIAAESQSTPKLTLTSAVCDCAKFPGKRLIVKAGTYTESLDTGVCAITGGSGPSYTTATTIETFGTDAVTIRSTPGYGMALWLRASESYILFKGSSTNRLVFDGTGGGGNTIALYPGTHHIRFEWVEVMSAQLYENVYAQNADTIEWYDALIHHAAMEGIAADGTTAGWIIQRTFFYNNGGHGLKAPAYGGSTTGLRLSESTLHDNTGNGVDLGVSTGVTLVNNVYYTNGGLGVQIRTGAVGAKVYFSSLYQDAVQCDSGATSAEIKNVISHGAGSGITNNCSASTATNYTSDPLYTNPGAGDLTLQNGSLAINAGTPLAGVTIDYAGNVRPDATNGLVDIGAYERCCPSGTPPGTSATVPGDRRRHAGMLF